MKWTPGDRGNVEDMRGRSGGMRMGGIGLGGLSSSFCSAGLLALISCRSPAAVVVSRMPTLRQLPEVRSPPHREKRTWSTSSMPSWRMRRALERLARQSVSADDDTVCSATRSNQPAASRSRRPARSTARPISAVYLDLGFFSELPEPLWRAGRFRAGIRPAHELGHHVQALIGMESRCGRCSRRVPISATPFGSDGAAGRLLCRRLGPRCRAGRARARREESNWNRATWKKVSTPPRHRRRSPPTNGWRPRRSRSVHARLVRAAGDLVPARVLQRRPSGVRDIPMTLTESP